MEYNIKIRVSMELAVQKSINAGFRYWGRDLLKFRFKIVHKLGKPIFSLTKCTHIFTKSYYSKKMNKKNN